MLREETPLERVVYVWSAAGVLAAIVLGLVQVYHTSGTEGLLKLLGAAGMSFAVVGKFIIFDGLREGASFTPRVLALMEFLLDLFFAYLFLSGLETLERIPKLGGWLRRMRSRAVEILRLYPRLKHMAFWGVAIYVFLPLAGTGAITGSFAARLVGLSRLEGVLAIAIGSAGMTLILVLLAQFLGSKGEELMNSPILLVSSILVLIAIGWIAYVRVLRLLKKG